MRGETNCTNEAEEGGGRKRGAGGKEGDGAVGRGREGGREGKPANVSARLCEKNLTPNSCGERLFLLHL